MGTHDIPAFNTGVVTAAPAKDTLRGALRIIRDEHFTLSTVLHSMQQMLHRGPGDERQQFFDVMRAMLFYIDEFPEKCHHPKESNLLFPALARAAPELMPVIKALEMEHMKGHQRVRELQHLLLAWELLGESHRQQFTDDVLDYISLYHKHIKTEETQLLPVAERRLTAEEREELDTAFQSNCDPLEPGSRDKSYERLFTRIVLHAPAPGLGLGLG